MKNYLLDTMYQTGFNSVSVSQGTTVDDNEFRINSSSSQLAAEINATKTEMSNLTNSNSILNN